MLGVDERKALGACFFVHMFCSIDVQFKLQTVTQPCYLHVLLDSFSHPGNSCRFQPVEVDFGFQSAVSLLPELRQSKITSKTTYPDIDTRLDFCYLSLRWLGKME